MGFGIMMNAEYVLVHGASFPPGQEPMESWEEGTEAAKVLIFFSGDAVAHGSYSAFDPNIFGDRRPKGMFRSTGNGRFHFNCSARCGAEGDDHILVKRMALTRKGSQKLWRSLPLAELNKKFSCVDSFRKAISSGDTAILKGAWISKFSKQGGIMPRSQNLPDDAVWSPEELCKSERRTACPPLDLPSAPGGTVVLLPGSWVRAAGTRGESH